MKSGVRIKTFLLLVTGLVLSANAETLTAEQIEIRERTDQAVKEAIGQAQKSLAAAPVKPGAAIAVLPFYNDEAAVIRDRMKNAVTACGKACVEDKDSKILEDILKEIAWDERKTDVMDPATVVKFGRLRGAQYLLYGGLLSRNTTDRYVLVELEFHLTEIATKKHVWGGTFVSRLYSPEQERQGRIEIPTEIRRMLREQLRASIAASLSKSNKLKGVQTAVILPLSADTDGYLHGFVRDVVASSSLTPVELDVRTRTEARSALRDGLVKGDAIVYGTVRDFSAMVKSVHPDQSRTYTASVEIQLWMEKGGTREILWSDTVLESKDYEDNVGPWDLLCRWFPSLVAKPWLIVVVPLVVLLGLVVLLVVVKNATRVR